jgi:hypothetical protein
MGIPDLRHINRKIPVADVARALGLRFGDNGNIHCWDPERHQNGDRTASVGIRKANNTVKCFGCGAGPMGPVDLMMTVLQLKSPGEAARWIAGHFEVPDLPPGRHVVQPRRHIFRVGFEDEVGLLVRSGIWARLSTPARSLVPVLLELADRDSETRSLSARLSYRALSRYSGVASPNAIKKAIRELQEIGWLSVMAGPRTPCSGPVREISIYVLTPRSDELLELANANFAQQRDEIEIERKLRKEARALRSRCVITK